MHDEPNKSTMIQGFGCENVSFVELKKAFEDLNNV